MAEYKKLREFKKDELLLNEEETTIILKFIFESVDYEYIDKLTINDAVRGFAQGLLLEAIDASYAVGFVEAIFRSTANPTKGAVTIIKSFAKKALKHWFKHATANDLHDVKIYEFIRLELARKFRDSLRLVVASVTVTKQPSAFLAYEKPVKGGLKVWG